MIRVKLPLPPKELSPNARVHWRRHAKAKKAYRRHAWLVATSACPNPPRWKNATARATFRFPTAMRRDGDNLLASLKTAYDGIADAGVVDNDRNLTHLPVVQIKDPSDVGVTIEIEEGTSDGVHRSPSDC